MIKTTGRVQQISFLMMVAGALFFLCWPQRTVQPAYAQGSPLIHQESEVVSGGSGHTCAITSGGGLKCWGQNTSGQLGTGNYTSTLTAADVVGLGSGVVAVSAGESHTCAVTSGGSAKCWGQNNYGQLGYGSTTSYNTPVDVVGLDINVTTISVGESHTCALTNSGGVQCWGDNSSGQVGDGTTTNRLAPVPVVGLSSGVAAISVGASHTCAVTSGGGVKCWGYNSNGQLGDGTTTNQVAPVDVAGLSSGVISISAGGAHTCVLTNTGGIKCWGHNGYGQIGDGTRTSKLTAVDVAGSTSGMTSISAGTYHTCASTSLGRTKCWGYNYDGQLGNGGGSTSSTPVDATGLNNGTVAVALGNFHSCALMTTGVLKCWGVNSNGRLGDGTTTHRTTPVDVLSLTVKVPGGVPPTPTPVAPTPTPTPKPTVVVTGKVVDTDGRPVSGVTVNLQREESVEAVYTTNIDGNYSFIIEAAGTYAIKPSYGGYFFSPEEISYQVTSIGLINGGTNSVADIIMRPCTSQKSSLNVCLLEKGDILLDRSNLNFSKNGFASVLVATYWFHGAIYVGGGSIVHAIQSPSEEDQLLMQPVFDTGWWNPGEDYDWAVIRPRVSSILKQQVVNYAITRANKTNPPVLYVDVPNFFDVLNEDRVYCTQFVWLAYKKFGTDLEYNMGPISDSIGATVKTGDDLFYSTSILSGPKADLVQMNPNSSHWERLVFALFSPADLLLQDSLGRRIGRDPSTGVVYNEIPEAMYTGPDIEPETISVMASKDLTWTLNLVGTGEGGVYHLESRTLVNSEPISQVLRNVITTGAQHIYQLNSSVVDGSVITATTPITVTPTPVVRYDLITTSVGSGSISVSTPGPYSSGTQVQITATPAAGWRFVRWESTAALGDQATQSIITVTVTGEATYTAHFELDTSPPSPNSIYLPLVTR